MTAAKFAPGWPGIPARWTSSAKSGVGTALNNTSRVWFTVSHGILDEIYYPRMDRACTRDCGLIVTDGTAFFSEEKRDCTHEVAYPEPGVPAIRLINTCKQGRYRIEKEIIADPRRDCLLQRIRFTPLKGKTSDYHLYVILAPHLGDRGSANTAWVGSLKGVPMLLGRRGSYAVAMGSTSPWLSRSAGFAGTSDGWQDLVHHKRMQWVYERAENGNVALTGEIDLDAGNGTFVLALGFGEDHYDAAYQVRASLFVGYDKARQEYIKGWQEWQEKLLPLEQNDPGKSDLYRVSTAVMHVHEAKAFEGGIIASLSIPWGFAKGDEDLGGYHLVWVRDLVEAAIGLLAAGVKDLTNRVMRYLEATQDADGKWPQNMWLAGTPYWSGVQMDETSFPILLLDHVKREGFMGNDDLARFWPMVKKAAAYLLRNGPVTMEDRWEMDPGYSPFTLAAEVAALLSAADFAEAMKEARAASYMRETADNWNANIERWIYVNDTDIDRKVGVEGHYVRIGSPGERGASVSQREKHPEKKLSSQIVAAEAYSVGPDALALVRFGLRDAKDSRMVNTMKVVDAYLKVDTACGPAWRRYIGDDYGEHADGSPYDGTGIGRAWPLLTGERAHYELAAGRVEEAKKLLKTMEQFADAGGMIPEQVWDAADIPDKELYNGRPTGSGMPLVWAHAEYVKLRRSIRDGKVYDVPPQPVERYQVKKTGTPYVTWRFNNKCFTIPRGKTLRIETLAAAMVRWSADGWKTFRDDETKDTTMGVHTLDIPTQGMAQKTISFTFYWTDARRWEEKNFDVTIGGAEA